MCARRKPFCCAFTSSRKPEPPACSSRAGLCFSPVANTIRLFCSICPSDREYQKLTRECTPLFFCAQKLATRGKSVAFGHVCVAVHALHQVEVFPTSFQKLKILLNESRKNGCSFLVVNSFPIQTRERFDIFYKTVTAGTAAALMDRMRVPVANERVGVQSFFNWLP